MMHLFTIVEAKVTDTGFFNFFTSQECEGYTCSVGSSDTHGKDDSRPSLSWEVMNYLVEN